MKRILIPEDTIEQYREIGGQYIHFMPNHICMSQKEYTDPVFHYFSLQLPKSDRLLALIILERSGCCC